MQKHKKINKSSISETLSEIKMHVDAHETVTMEMIVKLLGRRSFGMLIAIFSIFSILPISSILSVSFYQPCLQLF